MAYLRDIFLALTTPWGRLSQLPFIVLAAILLAVHGALQAYVSTHVDDLEAYNPYAIGQIVTLWMFFSILSRRFHDSGNAALLLVPYFAMTFAVYLLAMDNYKLAVSPFEDDHATAAWFERVRMVYQLIGFGVIIMALKDAGDDIGNAYGAPFGGAAPARKRREVSQAEPHGGEQPRVRRVVETHTDQPAAPQPHHNRRATDVRRGRITPAGPAGRPHEFGHRR